MGSKHGVGIDVFATRHGGVTLTKAICVRLTDPSDVSSAHHASMIDETSLELARPDAYNFPMPNAARQLIDYFEALPEQEKHEVLSQLLRRVMDKPYASTSDENLVGRAIAL